MQTRSSEWPPSVKDCPDYWDPVVKKDANGEIISNHCVNTFEIGGAMSGCTTTEGEVFQEIKMVYVLKNICRKM